MRPSILPRKSAIIKLLFHLFSYDLWRKKRTMKSRMVAFFWHVAEFATRKNQTLSIKRKVEPSIFRSMLKTQNDWEKGHSVYLRAINICQNSLPRSKRASFAELRELRMSKLFFIAEGKFGKKQFSVRQHWYVASVDRSIRTASFVKW